MDLLISKPTIVFREEFDDWALLYDPDTGDAFGLNPIGATIWKNLDGNNTIGGLAEMIRRDFKNVPEDVDAQISSFLMALKEKGLAGVEIRSRAEIK
jgi:SynChlorMet cassette protein ScmD